MTVVWTTKVTTVTTVTNTAKLTILLMHAAGPVGRPRKKKRGRQARLDMAFVNLDGKVFTLEQFRSAHPLARGCFSNKTKPSGLQTLVWSTPCGIPFLVTGLFAAKLSEKHQVALHSGWLVAVPKGVAILEDRGFRWLQRHYPK